MTIQSKGGKKKGHKIAFKINAIDLIEHQFGTPSDLSRVSQLKLYSSLSITFDVDSGKNILSILVQYEFYGEERERIFLFSMKTSTEFEIDNLKDYQEGNTLKPDGFFMALLEMSLHHTRGIQSQLIKNTQMDTYFIPAYHIKELMKGASKQNSGS